MASCKIRILNVMGTEARWAFNCFFQCARYIGHFILSLLFLHSGRRLVQYRLQGRLVGGGVFAIGVDILGNPLALKC